jgi:hypothetical protein
MSTSAMRDMVDEVCAAQGAGGGEGGVGRSDEGEKGLSVWGEAAGIVASGGSGSGGSGWSPLLPGANLGAHTASNAEALHRNGRNGQVSHRANMISLSHGHSSTAR